MLPDKIERRKVKAGHWRVEGYTVIRSAPARWDAFLGDDLVRSFATLNDAMSWIADDYGMGF